MLSADDGTKDAPVSITPDQLSELSEFRGLPKEEQRAVVERYIANWETLLGESRRPLSHVEDLNRDYYRGRFASPGEGGGWIYNWEDTDLP